MRSGIIAKKIGMSNLYTQSGTNIPVTVLHVENCKIIDRITSENENSDKVLVGACKLKKTSKSQKGFFDKKKSDAYKYLREFEISKDQEIKSGDELKASHFKEGQFIDVSGYTKGKGFAGVMKRHNFSGQKASHGVHKVHRAGGSIGNASYPGHVFKGQKMAGRMGNEKSTIQSVTIVGLNEEKNYLLVNGSVPGNKGNIVKVQKAVKVKQ